MLIYKNEFTSKKIERNKRLNNNKTIPNNEVI